MNKKIPNKWLCKYELCSRCGGATRESVNDPIKRVRFDDAHRGMGQEPSWLRFGKGFRKGKFLPGGLTEA